MRTTASFELFPDAPSERVMARARYLAREGRLVDAERAYRDVLAQHPDLKGGWAGWGPGAARPGGAGDRRHPPLRVLRAAPPRRADADGALVRRNRHRRARVRRRQRRPG